MTGEEFRRASADAELAQERSACATQAAIRAGYSAATANQQGPRLLVNVGISEAVAELRKEQSERCKFAADQAGAHLARLRNGLPASGGHPRLLRHLAGPSQELVAARSPETITFDNRS
jgi:Terminase small subunit